MEPQDYESLVGRVQAALTPDLLKPAWRDWAKGRHPLTGHCYAASEAIFWLQGGLDAEASMMYIRHEDLPHWFVKLADGTIIDPTADQFETPVPYDQAKANNGFVRQHGVSKRALEIIRRVDW